MKEPGEAAAPGWTAARERGQAPVVRFMVWLSLRLGRRLSRPVLHGIALYFLLFSPAARAGLQRFYAHLWQRPAGWLELYRHFFSFATVIHDRVFLLNHQWAQFAFDDRAANAVLDRVLADDGQGMVVLGAHLGSFESLRALAQARGVTAWMVMYEENAGQLNRVLASINPRAPRHVIALNRVDSMLFARERLEQGDVLGLLADRNFAPDDMQWLPFLGEAAPFPRGPLRLAALLQCRVLFMASLYVRGNRYHVHAAELADFRGCPRHERAARQHQAQLAYVRELETLCRIHPDNWFNFFDFWQAGAPPASR